MPLFNDIVTIAVKVSVFENIRFEEYQANIKNNSEFSEFQSTMNFE